VAKFFIDRPIFAWVIAIVIMLAGGLSITRLPVSQYPAIAPPGINVSRRTRALRRRRSRRLSRK
jgi:multidrug efflux pump